MADFREECLQVIAKTQQRLEEKKEWEERYADYAKQLLDKRGSVAARREQFHEYAKLPYYLNIGKIKEAEKTLLVDVRFRGQTVAEMAVTDDDVRLRTPKKIKETNETNFGCKIAFPRSVPWAGEEARALRKYFFDLADKDGNIPEHNIESLLLSEFLKDKGADKGVVGIQPVLYPKLDRKRDGKEVTGFRFAMATPLSACKPREIKYSGRYGGGIDILARTGRGKVMLTIVEVKNPYKAPKNALKQAIAYATFILKLLRSESGSGWWSLFGFTGKLPETGLTVRAVAAMPHHKDKSLDDTSFAKQLLPVGNDWIECHYIYFEHDAKTNALSGFSASL